MPAILLYLATAILSILAHSATAQTVNTKPCPLLGLSYPQPSSYATAVAIQSAVNSLQNAISILNNASSSTYGTFEGNTTAFAVDLYSLHDEESLFNHFSTPDGVKAQHIEGVGSVDANTVFRIGSVSKLLTVYAMLVEVGSKSYSESLPLSTSF